MKRILIVDDKEENIYMLRFVLEGQGYEVVEAANGAEALEKAHSTQPDLIVADILMPVMDGFTLCQKWRADPALRNIPFIFYTATYTDSKDEELALSLGADRFVLKPQEPEQLAAIVQEVLELGIGTIRQPASPAPREPVQVMRQYSEVLVRKLEHKIDDLDAARMRLQEEIEERRKAESEARNARDFYLKTLRDAPVLIWRAGADGRCDWFNHTWLEFTGRTMAEEIEGGWIRHVHADDREGANRIYNAAFETRQPFEIECRIQHRSGEYRWIVVLGRPLLDLDEGFAGCIGYCFDNTSRRQAEVALGYERSLMQALMSTIPASVYFKDRESRFIMVSSAKAERHGRTPAELVGKTDFDLFSERHARQAFDDEQRIIKTGEGMVDVEERVTWSDRPDTWAMTTKMPLRDSGGRIIGTFGISSDITERKRTEARIHEQAELLDKANDAIYVRTMGGVITFWNNAAEALYGWTRAEAVGRTLAELNIRDIEAQAGSESPALMREGGWTGERRQYTKTGREVTVFTRLTLMKDEKGRPASVFAINSDITEQKQLEARYLQAQRLESIGALASGLAHDLNNVLGPVLLGASMLKEKMATPGERKMLATMEESARRGADIVRQVLTFARGIEGQRVPVQVRHLIREMSDIALETFPRNIQFQAEAGRELWPVIGDATQLHQILMNLCINARDAMPQGGKLELTASNVVLDEAFAAMTPGAKAGPHICIKVIDTGTGIPKGNLDRLFEPFFTTKEKGKGTGLGLPTVLGIVKSHGGVIQVRSTVGRGSSFEVYLPAAPDVDVRAEKDAAAEIPGGSGEMVLVVDDEMALREIACSILEKHGYTAVSASDGTEAMVMFMQNREKIAAVFTDMWMPGMDGPSLAKLLRRIAPQVHLIGSTGVGEPTAMETVEALHLPALLIKPYTAEKLLLALHQVLHARPADAGAGAKA